MRPLQVFRTRGGQLRTARTIPERKNALEGPSRRQKGVCSPVPGAKKEIPAHAGQEDSMKRVSFCAVVFGMCFFCVSTARAQQDPGFIPVWDNSLNLINSLIFQTADGRLVINTSTTPNDAILLVNNSGNGHALTGLTNGGTGVTGITFSSSDGANGVFGSANASSGGTFGVQGFSLSPQGVGVQGSSTNVAVAGINQTCSASSCTPTTGIAGHFVTASSGTILLGTNFDGTTFSNVFRVDSTGRVFADGGFQSNGADFAESMPVTGDRSKYEAADLLVIDSKGKSRLALSRQPYSTLVAGIFSTKPGVLGTAQRFDETSHANEVPLAVVGIVPCKVTAENGPIAAGDLLVTSSTPGHAMKGTDRARMLGAVVGKALEPLQGGTGVIQVLVTLQ